MDELVEEMKKSVMERKRIDDYILLGRSYDPIKIEDKNFHAIKKSADKDCPLKILFVDGGQSVLFESSVFCIAIIRTCALLYEKSRKKTMKEDFFIIVRAQEDDYITKTFPEGKFSGLKFKAYDEMLKDGIEKCSITKIISLVRRLAELDFAAANAEIADSIIMDGTLEARYPYEMEYVDRLIKSRKAAALAKTCSLLTRSGDSITRKLISMNKSIWYYHPACVNNNKIHPAEIYFVRFSDKNDYSFRFEIQKDFSRDREELFSSLLLNSRDPIFLGYPYGLIDVDMNARVSEEEKNMLQTRFSVKMGKHWNDFSKYLYSMDAHKILDKIRF